MSRRSLAISSVVCAAALAAPAAASARVVSLPKISSVSPLRAAIGQRLVLRGSGFLAGTGRNVVVFQRRGGRAVFVRSGRANHHSVSVVLSSKLRPFLTLRNGAPVATRFSLNVLAHRFGAHFTPTRLSPVVSESDQGPGGGPSGACNPQSSDFSPSGDADHDLLSNALEVQIHTDPCNPDTDGDNLPDGYEYRSALDLNRQPISFVAVDTSVLPYPGRRPYPNPLDPTDSSYDYDGDGLTLADEYHAWAKYGDTTTLSSLLYSDGTQHSQGSATTDDLKDVDNDGLGNWVELHGFGQPEWWTINYKEEQPYTLRPWAGPDWLNPDTDGDGLKDGADDTDHDGYSDAVEMDGLRLSGWWVQPFNPCLPDPTSQTCSRYHPKENSWEPFKTGWTELGPPLLWPRP
jgi:hypothetical protein